MPSKFTKKFLAEWLQEHVSNHNSDACLIWPYAKAGGYGQVHFQGKRRSAHRVAFLVAHGRWPNPQALHSCDTPACFNARHLYEGSHTKNMQDKVSRNRQSCLKGSRNPAAHFTEDVIREIRREYERPTRRGNGKVLASKYGVNRATICDIATGRTWKHVK